MVDTGSSPTVMKTAGVREERPRDGDARGACPLQGETEGVVDTEACGQDQVGGQRAGGCDMLAEWSEAPLC